QIETKIASLQNELQSNIYKNTKLRTKFFKKVSDQKDNTQDSSKNTKFAKQPIAEILPKIGETNTLSKPVTSNSVSTPQVFKGVNNAKVISPGMFRISPDKISKEAKKMPNTVSASSRTKLITVSQPNVITKKKVNSNLNGLSSTGLDNTKTRRPQPRSNTKNVRVPSASKSSRSKNKDVKVEEHHRNLLLSKKNKHISSACNNSKIDSQDVISKSRGRKHKANVSKNETQKKYRPKVSKPKNVGTRKSLATPKPRKPRFLLMWSLIGKMFDQDGKLVVPSNSGSHVDCSNGCSKHMTGNLKLLINFVWKFLGTVRFGNDHVAAILGFGDLQWGNILITRVYFVEEFKNQVLKVYFDSVGISHLMYSVRTPQQNGVVERRNRTLVEAARTMLILSRAPLFLWAEAIATACFTQNRSIIHRRFNKTPYELINGRKPDISFLHVFGALCYPKNDREDIGKLGAKGD
nr:retrovirus-related Pol polyprotein from transposon TNT 1-94 [Tanacetum cinerariifolium]